MPFFSFKGVDAAGSDENGEVAGASEAEVLGALKARGITVYELCSQSEEKQKPWYLRDLDFGRTGISAAALADLSELLSALFRAQLPALEVVRVAQRSASIPAVRKHLSNVEYALQEGSGFSDAFSSGGLKLPPLFCAFLKVGEASNELAITLADVATFYRAQSEFKSGVFAALIYPAILIIAATGLLGMVVFFLAPSLVPVFESNNVDLPGSISALMAVNEFLAAYWLPILIVSIGLILGGVAGSQSGTFKSNLQHLSLIIRPIRNYRYLSETAQIARSLSLLLSAGVPLGEAFEELEGIFKSGPLSRCLSDAVQYVKHGGNASDVFEKDVNIPVIFREVFKIGVEMNQLPDLLPAATQTMEHLAKRSLENFSVLLTPVITLVLGAGIGYLVYSMMGAILDINDVAF